jgi:hypothetical protein
MQFKVGAAGATAEAGVAAWATCVRAVYSEKKPRRRPGL